MADLNNESVIMPKINWRKRHLQWMSKVLQHDFHPMNKAYQLSYLSAVRYALLVSESQQ